MEVSQTSQQRPGSGLLRGQSLSRDGLPARRSSSAPGLPQTRSSSGEAQPGQAEALVGSQLSDSNLPRGA